MFCLSPWGKNERIGRTEYIKAEPYRFRSVIKKIKPDVVRAYDGFKCADWACVNRVKNIPVMVSVHDTNPELIRDSLQYADAVVCMSNAVKEAVNRKVPIEKDRIFVMPNRINTDLFSKKCDKEYFDKLDKVYGNGKHILHVGRKAEQKNLDTLIRALAYLPKEYSALFVGKGDVEPYSQLAKECHVEERCFFIDSIKAENLPYYYSWCDCMCTPSRWEGFGFVFIEAAACEAAIVTSDIKPMCEYLTNQKTAFLVKDYENPEEIAKYILKACSNEDTIIAMKKQARNVGLNFEKSKVDKQEVELYQELMARGSRNLKCSDWKIIKRVIKSSQKVRTFEAVIKRMIERLNVLITISRKENK